MDSDKSASTGSEHANSLAPDKRGKYRIMAEIKRLEQDSKFLEEELEELERLEDASSICKELLLYVEMKPDALLPVVSSASASEPCSLVDVLIPLITGLMAQQTHRGIDGLRGFKIQKAADAG